MMSSSCEVIRDLLPLYHDGVCSDGSKLFVEEHLRGCSACQKELEMMDLELPTAHMHSQSVSSFRAASAAWKKSKKKSFTKGICITVAIFMLTLACFYGLTQWKCIPISADDMEATNLAQFSDGCIVFILSLDNGQKSSSTKLTTTANGELYITPMHSVIETSDRTEANYYFYPARFKTAEPEHPGLSLPENVTKIYIGPVGKGTLVWEEGMDIPTASEPLN